MFSIDNRMKIQLTKEDTATFYCTITDLDENSRAPEEGDTLTMTIFSDEVYVQKEATINNNQWLFTIDSSDTDTMVPTIYLYNIKLTNSAGSKYTVIDNSVFELLGGN